jgi:hypothetical protein
VSKRRRDPDKQTSLVPEPPPPEKAPKRSSKLSPADMAQVAEWLHKQAKRWAIRHQPAYRVLALMVKFPDGALRVPSVEEVESFVRNLADGLVDTMVHEPSASIVVSTCFVELTVSLKGANHLLSVQLRLRTDKEELLPRRPGN